MNFIERKKVTMGMADQYGWTGSNIPKENHNDPYITADDPDGLMVDVFKMTAQEFNILALISRSKGESGELVTDDVAVITDGYALYFSQGSLMDGDSQGILANLLLGNWDEIKKLDKGVFINMY